MRSGKSFKNPNTKILLFNAYIRSNLEYCSVVWRPHYSTHSLRIERLQKRFVRHLAYTSGVAKVLGSYTERLRHFGMVTLEQRRDFLDALFLYKILNNHIDCPALLEQVRFRVPYRYPRQAIMTFSTPARRTVLGQNSPLYRMCKAHNKHCSSVDICSSTLYGFRKSMFALLTSE